MSETMQKWKQLTKRLGLEEIFEDPQEIATLDSLILQMIFRVIEASSLSAVQSWLYVSSILKWSDM